MQKDQFFIAIFVLLAIITASAVVQLLNSITQKAATASEENVQSQLEIFSKSFEIVDLKENKLYIKNTGNEEITDLKVYVDNIEVRAVFDPIAPKTVGLITLSNTSGQTLSVVSTYFSQELKIK